MFSCHERSLLRSPASPHSAARRTWPALLLILGLLGLGGCAEARHEPDANGSSGAAAAAGTPASPSPSTWGKFTIKPTIEPYTPFPRDTYAKGSDGDRILRALLRRFGGATAPSEPPPTVVSVRNPRVDELVAAQLGNVAYTDPACVMWTQGIWSQAARSAGQDPDGIIGSVLLVDMSNGLFGAPFASEAIVRSTAGLDVSSPPRRCLRTRAGNAVTWWTYRIEHIDLSREVGESPQAYRLIVTDAGDVPDRWVAVFRVGRYVVEVKLMVYPKTDDLAAQQTMLEELAAKAYAKASGVLS